MVLFVLEKSRYHGFGLTYTAVDPDLLLVELHLSQVSFS